MKTRNKVLSVAAVLALGLGGFGGTFALWSAEKSVSGVTLATGHVKLSDPSNIGEAKWIDLTGVSNTDLIAKAVGSPTELDTAPVLAPGGVYGKIVSITPDVKGQNLVAKLTAAATENTSPWTLKVGKVWTAQDGSDAVDGSTSIEFVEDNDLITMPGNDGETRIENGQVFRVLVLAGMEGQATGNMDESEITFPNVKITAVQVSPDDLKAAS